MAGILFITAAEVGEIARLNIAGDTTAAADVDGVLTNEQPAIEAMLDPAAFGDASLTPLLRRNVARLLAAEVLEMRRREEGADGNITATTGIGIAVSGIPDHAAALRAEAWASLAPWARRVPGAVPLSSDPKAALAQAQAEKAVAELLAGLVKQGVLGAGEARVRLGLPDPAPAATVSRAGSAGLTPGEMTRLFGRREADRIGVTGDEISPSGWAP